MAMEFTVYLIMEFTVYVILMDKGLLLYMILG